MPLFLSDCLDICDPVLAFDRIMEEIGIEKYLRPEPLHRIGRPGYNRVNMLKTVLFGFMDTGYASLRELEDRCKVNIRYMYLMDHETPSYRAFSYFINEEIKGSAQDIFKAVMPYIQTAEGIDLQHLYIWLKIRGKRKQVYNRYISNDNCDIIKLLHDYITTIYVGGTNHDEGRSYLCKAVR